MRARPARGFAALIVFPVAAAKPSFAELSRAASGKPAQPAAESERPGRAVLHARARKLLPAEPVGGGAAGASFEDATPIDRLQRSSDRRPRTGSLDRLSREAGDLPQRIHTGIDAGAKPAVEAAGS